MMRSKHPRLAYWLTVIPAAIGALLAVYHLFVVAFTLADPNYSPMLEGFTGSIYMLFDYFLISLPICLLLLLSLLLNLLASRALKMRWSISAIVAIAVFLICGSLILLGANSGLLTVSLNLAARTIAEAITAVTLACGLTRIPHRIEHETVD